MDTCSYTQSSLFHRTCSVKRFLVKRRSDARARTCTRTGVCEGVRMHVGCLCVCTLSARYRWRYKKECLRLQTVLERDVQRLQTVCGSEAEG